MITWLKFGGIVGLALAIFFAGYHLGGMAPKLAQAKAEVKQEVAQDTKRATDQTTVEKEAKAYEDAALAPIVAPIARMCDYSNTAAAVPSAHAAGPGAHASAAAIPANPLPPVPGPDIGSGLLRAAAIAESQVTQLQDYVVHVCQGGKT